MSEVLKVSQATIEREWNFERDWLRRDDFLVVRMVEITVHSDDLAVSVGLTAPSLPPAVLAPVLGLLTRLAVRRHGQSAVVAALTRAERAPAAINAF